MNRFFQFQTKLFHIILLLVFMLACGQPQQNFLDETKEDKEKRMEWWKDARFGMFIHWGLYSIPAGEWKEETNHAEWIRTTAQIPLQEYDQFAGQFNPEKYNPAAWVQIAKQAGMKYIVITSKHHDGFCLFDSKYTDFDVLSTPYGKDLLDQLANACRQEDIKICWYYSIMDWHHPDYLPRRTWEVDRPENNADFKNYISFLKHQLKEIVTNYGDIGVLWFDGEWEETWSNEYGKEIYNFVRNLQPDIIINNRVDVGRSGMAGLTRPGEFVGDFGTPEQEIPATGLPGVYWETCMTMNDHWGYNKNDNQWKSPKELIQKLADIASKGGNFLLNVGPTSEGLFPDESILRLQQIGEWMKTNGESIYKTSAGPFTNLTFGRCTQKTLTYGTRLYFHVFDWPKDNQLIIPGLYNQPLKAFLLSDLGKNPLEITRNDDGVIISVPVQAPDTINTIVVLDIEGVPDINQAPEIHSSHDIFVDFISINISSCCGQCDVYYTLDGSQPDLNSQKVTGPMVLKSTCIVAARCYRNGKPVSDVVQKTITKVKTIPAVNPGDVEPGLYCNYFEGTWDSLPAFERMEPLKKMESVDFDLSLRENENHYGFLFEGYIEISEDGVYDFYTDSDDGSQLFIDDSLVVDNDGLHGMKQKGGVIPLSKGLHKINVKFFERDGNDELKIYYKGPSFEKKPLPKNTLYKKK